MSTHPGFASLLTHERFVRSLAQTLVADPAAADDLVQDTWVAALRRPPRAVRTLPAWLAEVMRNQFRNTRRADLRRIARERAVARGEADDRDLAERVALEHEVVTAVLALREPYRSVVLLRYYEGLDAAEIARRRGVPGATVRSWLKRALDELRARLDASRPGGRAAWCALLLPRPKQAALPVTSLKAAAGAVVAIGGGALMLAAVGAPPMAPAAAMRAELADPTRPSDAPDAPRAAAIGAPTSTAPERLPAAPPMRQDPDLDGSSVPALLELALHTQALLRARLLEPEPELVAQAQLDGTPDSGVVRILRAERFETTQQLGLRGGGAYFSFRTRLHDYDAEPDLSLRGGNWQSGFYGGTGGFMLDLGAVDLRAIEPEPPAGTPADRRAAWTHLFADAGMTDRGYDDTWRERAAALGLQGYAHAAVGRTWLLRAILPGEHDHLVAFQSLREDAYGHTIAWRILRTFLDDAARDPLPQPARASGAPPAWLAQTDAAGLLDALAKIRSAAAPQLLEVPPEIAQRYAAHGPHEGVCRILPRGRFQSVLAVEGGGAYWSFVTRSHDYQAEPDLELQQGDYSSGFAGQDQGYLLDLGEHALELADREPPGLDERGRRAWRFVRGFRSSRDRSGGFQVDADDRERARGLALDRSVPAIVGHTYLLRSVQAEHDVTVAFTTIAADEDGHTLVWRVLDLQR